MLSWYSSWKHKLTESLTGHFYNIALFSSTKSVLSWYSSWKHKLTQSLIGHFYNSRLHGQSRDKVSWRASGKRMRKHKLTENSNTSELSFWGSIWWFILPVILQIPTLLSFHFEAPFGDLFCRSFCKFQYFWALILRLHLVIYSAGHSARSAGGKLQINMHTPYVYGFAWSDMPVWCTQNTPRWQWFHVAPAMPVL